MCKSMFKVIVLVRGMLAMHKALYAQDLLSLNAPHVVCIATPILQTRKLKVREIE